MLSMPRMRAPLVLVAIALTFALSCRPKPAVSDAPDRSGDVADGKTDPPGGTSLGPVEAMDGGGCGALGVTGTYEGALRAVKNKAIALGATYVKVVEMIPPHEVTACFDKGYTLRAIAFRVPAPAAPPSADGDAGAPDAPSPVTGP